MVKERNQGRLDNNGWRERFHRVSHGFQSVVILVSMPVIGNIVFRSINFCNRGINGLGLWRGMLLFAFGNLSHTSTSITCYYTPN
jgi:hypothetical protein